MCDSVLRVDFKRSLVFLDRLFVLTELIQRYAPVVVSCDIIRFKI